MAARAAWILLLLLALPLRAQQDEPIPSLAFTVSVRDPGSGKIQVSLVVAPNREDEVLLSIPAWAPGAYRIVKYGRQVWNVAATGADGRELEVVPVDDQTWKVRSGRATSFTVTYELTVDRSRMDPEHCFIAGPDTYFYIVGRKDVPCSVRFKLPDGWKVGTGLEPAGETYRAPDYDTFIDCPTELGKFELYSFAADQAAYEIVVHAKGPVDGAKLMLMCRKIVQEQNRIFGPPPFRRYVFLYHFKDATGGRGLEHLNSTDIIMPYNAIRVDPLLAASVTSHEYFHLWNVKRIRPVELGPFDYTKIVRSKALWMCEGVTSYYGDRSLLRSGLWKEQQYLDHLAGEIETLQNNADRKVTSIEKASETIWDRKDYPRVDYYNKGELLGLLIDLKIRMASGGKRTFDDVLRQLYETYVTGPAKQGKGHIGVGYPEDGILRSLNDVTGSDWNDFYARYVRGVEELPLGEVLGAAGLEANIVVQDLPDLGMDLRGTFIANVPEGSEAARAAIKAGDRILALNGSEATRSNLRQLLNGLKPGENATLKLLLAAGGETEITLKVGLRQRTSCKLRRAEGLSEARKQLLDAWLGASRDF